MEETASCCKRWNNIPGILRSVSFIDLTFKASNIVEKLIWLTIGLMGLAWAGIFITNLVITKEINVLVILEDGRQKMRLLEGSLLGEKNMLKPK